MPLPRFQRRYLICIMVAWGMFVTSCLFNNMNVAIVQMSTKYNVTLENGTLVQVADFDWDSVRRGHILSSRHYGTAICSLAAGILSSKFGGVAVFGSGILISSILTIATPYATNYGFYSVVSIRALEGFFASAGSSCRMIIFSKWIPPGERSRMVAATILGGDIGNTICYSLFGIIAQYWGWSVLFYLPGIIGILWCCVWFAIVKDDPADDRKLKQKELHFLHSSITADSFKKVHHLWKKIMTSNAVWCQIISNVVALCGYTTLYLQFPIFLGGYTFICDFVLSILLGSPRKPTIQEYVFRLDIKTIGYSTSAPYFAVIFISPFIAILSDYLVIKKGYSITMVRKLFCGVGAYCAAAFALLLPFSDSLIIVVILMTLFLTFHGAYHSTINVNCLDISPRHSSVLFGIGASIGTVGAITCSTLTGYIVTNQSREEWKWVYILCSMLYIFGGTHFLLLGTGEVQSWAIDTDDLQNNQTLEKGELLSSPIGSVHSSNLQKEHSSNLKL